MNTAVRCLVLLVCSNTVFAATAADQFGAKSRPSVMKLTVNAEPALCNRDLADYNALFVSEAADLDLNAAIASDFPPLPMQPIDIGEGTGGSPLAGLELDLDADGHREAIVYRSNPFRDGSWNYAYVFPSMAAFEAKEQVFAQWGTSPNVQYPGHDKLELSARLYFPEASTVGNEKLDTGDVWAEHSLFEFAKHYYFIPGTTAFDRLTPQTLRMFRLRADGHVELTCELQNRGGSAAYAALQQLPAIVSLLKVIHRIGAGGDDTGSSHAGVDHDAQATAAETRAATRPWATSSAIKAGYGDDDDTLLLPLRSAHE